LLNYIEKSGFQPKQRIEHLRFKKSMGAEEDKEKLVVNLNLKT
jgi:hypothetical protein